MTPIVGLMGPAGVGKDTIAKALGYPTFAFATALKEMCKPVSDALGVDPAVREQKEKVRPVYVATGAAARAINPHFWIEKLSPALCPPGTYWDRPVAITDVRYLNECQWIWGMGGVVFDLRRDGVVPANEEETKSLAAVEDYCRRTGIYIPVILNNGSPEHAAQTIRDHLRYFAAEASERWGRS